MTDVVFGGINLGSSKREDLERHFERPLRLPDTIVINDQEIEEFLQKLEKNDFEDILSFDVARLEAYFLKSLGSFDYVGDLPITRQFFERFVEYIRVESEHEGSPDPRYLYPTLLVISMVFFARYSETDSSAFWMPYAQEVWGREDNQGKKNIRYVCSPLFQYARQHLYDKAGLFFDIDSKGDIVRPVYQHAIIPRYLHEHFVDWLVKNIEFLMYYSPDQLQRVLAVNPSLNPVHSRLRNFIQSADTREAAARLIARMIDAISLFDFDEEESSISVEMAFNSTLERSLWRVIYLKLSTDPVKRSVLRKVSPQLTWRWSEEKGLMLHLTNVRSLEVLKPKIIVWRHPEDREIQIRSSDDLVEPWKIKTAGIWELEPTDIRARGPLDGSLILLSDRYDVKEPRRDQEDYIILERAIPDLPGGVIFFRLNDRRDTAVLRNRIDADGTWVIFSQENIRFEDASGQVLGGTAITIPPTLFKLGFRHAIQIRLTLPVILTSHNQKFEKPVSRIDWNPILLGDRKLQRLIEDLPPIFSSPRVKLEMTCSFDNRSFRRYIFRVRKNGASHKSYYLSDLMRDGNLERTEEGCLIDLVPYISHPGAYAIDLMHNLKSVFDEPLQFAWLPDEVSITEPEVDTCYSPQRPLQIRVQGVPIEHVQPGVDEKYKKIKVEDQVEITWPMLRGKRCRFSLYWEDFPIHLCWEIDRVAAWITGGGDANHVLEGEEANTFLYIRGKPRDQYTWIVEGLESTREEYLNAKGEFEGRLSETVLRDMLHDSNQVQSMVSIRARDFEWRLFDFFRTPRIEITSVVYADSLLRVNLECDLTLVGDYTIQIRNQEFLTSVETIDEVRSLTSEITFPGELPPGLYSLEITSDGVIIAVSQAFRVIEETAGKTTRKDRVTVELSTDRRQVLFRALTSPLPHTLPWLDEGYGIDTILDQFEYIHTRENWLDDRSVEEIERRLLPSWAVLGFPLRFEMPHQRILHIFPEQVLYGGQIGKGYVDLMILDERLRAAAYWEPSSREGYMRLWMRMPQSPVESKLGELNPLDLWTAYQCKGCGGIVASRKSFLSPGIIQTHQHGRDVSFFEQFMNTVYPHKDDPLEATISQYKDERLVQTYQIEETIPAGYLQALMEGAIQPEDEDMEISVPVYWKDSFDFQVAVSELYQQLDQPEMIRLRDYAEAIEGIFNYFEDTETIVPPYAAALRMFQMLDEKEYPLNIPRHLFLIAMVLRTKAHKPIRFKKLMSKVALTEKDMLLLMDLALTCSPKLFEWSFAWTELLFLHAAS